MRRRLSPVPPEQDGPLGWFLLGFLFFSWLVIMLAIVTTPAEAQEGHVGLVGSYSGAFEGASLGAEVWVDHRYLHAEAQAFKMRKADGGDGTIVAGLVGVNLLQDSRIPIMVGARVSAMETERYERTDVWLVADISIFRLELEEETQVLAVRPVLQGKSGLTIRPEIGYIHGRGASGLFGGLMVGYSW